LKSFSVKGLENKVKSAEADRDSWKDAWYQQRLHTGKAYWDGYREAAKFLGVGEMPYVGKIT
jgi:hypothetical protein